MASLTFAFAFLVSFSALYFSASASPIKGCERQSGDPSLAPDTSSMAARMVTDSTNEKAQAEPSSKGDQLAVIERLSDELNELGVRRMAETGDESLRKKRPSTAEGQKSPKTITMGENGLEPHVKVLGGHIGGDERNPKLLEDAHSYLTDEERESISKYLKSKGMAGL